MSSIPRACRYWLMTLCVGVGVAPAFQAGGVGCFSSPPELAGWWPADGNANDIAAGNNGTLQGGATASAVGLVGSAFSFDGIDDYVRVPDAPALRPTNLTVEAWVRFSSLDSTGTANAGQQYIVFKQNSRDANFEGYDLGKWRSGGQDFFAFRVASSSGVLAEIFSTTAVTAGIWYHVAGVRGSNFLQLYVNGQLEGQTNVGFAQDYGATPLYLGSSGQAYWDRKFAGTLDEVSLYSRALSGSEVAAIYEAGEGGKCKGAGIAVQPQSQGVVVGSNAVFTVGATGLGVLSYQWRFDGTSILGATNPLLTRNNVQPTDAGSYTVVVTNSLGAVTSAIATLTVWTPPAISAQPLSRTNVVGTDASFSVTASGTPPPAYQWQFNGAAIAAATGSSLVRGAASFANAGGYRVVLSNVAGVVTSTVATLTVICPSVTVGPTSLRSGLLGSPYGQSLTASGGRGAYTFAVTTGALPPGLNLSSAGLLDGIPGVIGTNSFTVSATDTDGCAGTRAYSLGITGAPPVITLQPLSRTNVATTAATFSAAATGIPPLTYQWQFNGVALTDDGLISGARSNVLGLAAVQPGDAGNYRLVVSSTAGVTTSAVATLTVMVPPAIQVQPANRSAPAGGNAAFSVTASGTAPLSYQWRFNGTNLAGASGMSLMLSDVQPTQGGTYTVVVTNSAGSATSAAANLTVTAPPNITMQPASQEVVAGSDASLSVKALGAQPLSYQWQFKGGAIAGATGTNLTLGNVQPTDAGSYTVTVTNAAGSATSVAAVLAVLVPPAITAPPASSIVEAGANASFGVAVSGTSPLSYQWQFNGTNLFDGGALSGATAATLSLNSAQAANAGSYSVVVANVAGSVTSAVAILTVVSPAACAAAADGLVGWWPGDGSANDIAGNHNGTLQGGATASAAAVVGSAFRFDGTNGYVQIPDSPALKPANLTIEAWVNFSGLDSARSGTAPAGNQYIVFKQNSRSYYFEGYSLEKFRTANGDAFMFTIGSASGQEVILASQTLISTSVWYHVAAVRGSNYTELYVNGQLEGRTNAAFAQNYGNWPLYLGTSGQTYWDGRLRGLLDEVSLYNRALASDEIAAVYAAGAVGKCKGPGITIQPQSQGVVVGSSAVFTVAAGGWGTLSYQWQFNGAGISSATSTLLTLSNVQPADAGSYTVVVTNSLGAVTSGVAKLTVVCPSVILSPASLPGGTPGSAYSQSLTASGSPGPYSFAVSAGALPAGLYLSSAGALDGIPGTIGTNSFRVTATDINGCSTSQAYTLAVRAASPVITLQPQSRTNAAGTAATFPASATGTAPLNYQWRRNGVDLADNGLISGARSSTLEIAIVQPGDAGSYTLIVSNAAGAVTSAVAALTVTVPPAVNLPPASRSVPTGGNVTFSVTASGTVPLSYQWRFNGTNVVGATGMSLILGNVQPTDAGSYTVVVTNMAGSVTSAVAALEVLVPPAITAQPESLSVVAGNDTSFHVTASGTLPLSHQWRFNGTDMAGATGVSLTLSNVQPPNAGSYTVTVTNALGSATSAVATLTVVVPPVITLQPASLTDVIGTDVSFGVIASGTQPLSYQWTFNGGAIAGATSTTLAVTNAQPGDAGDYTVVVTNVAGSVTSAPATLLVIVPSPCVPAADGLVGWWPGDGNANDLAGINNGVFQGGAAAGTAGVVGSAFRFDGTNDCVRIPDSPVLRPTNLTIEGWVRFDSLDSPTVGNSPVGEQFLVFKEGVHLTYWSGFALTKMRVAGGDVFCFEVDSAAGQVAELHSQTLIQTGAWYHVAGVRGSNYLQLYVNGQLERQTNVSFAQSYGNYPLYFGTSGQPTWDHKLAGTLDEVSLYSRALFSNQIAAIHAAGAGGKCRAAAITAQPQSRTVAVGANVNLAVAASGSLPLIYRWQRDGVNLVNGGNVWGAYSPVLRLANVSLADSANYRVVITNVLGSVTSAVAVLRVVTNLSPPTITSQPLSQTVAPGTTVTFSVAASGTTPFSYQWRLNGTNLVDGGQVSGTTSPTLAINYLLPGNSGSYSVVITNELGAVTSAVATLTVSVPTECLTPPPGLVGWWPGDGNARDIVGTNNGTFQSGATADAPAVVGTGFSLDGTNNYIRIPDSPVLRPAELTVECWVKWNNLDAPGTSVYPGQQYIVFKQNSRMADFEAYVLSKDRTWDDIILWEVTSASGQLVRIDSTSPVTTNVWYHLAGVRGSNYIALYFNGRLEAQANVNFPQDYGNWPLYFGTSGQSYYDRKLNGVIDEVALYHRALSGSEIAVLYALGPAGKCKGTNGLLITAQPQSQSVPPGSSASFSVAAIGVTPMIYQWQFNNAPIASATNSSLALPVVQTTNAGSYKAVITNPAGTKTSAEAILTVTGQPMLLNPRSSSGGAFACALSGTTGLVYVIEVTTNFQQWAPLSWLTNPTGQADFMDAASSNHWSRFYRARVAD